MKVLKSKTQNNWFYWIITPALQENKEKWIYKNEKHEISDILCLNILKDWTITF